MEKDESEFHKNKSKKFGLASQCKNCESLRKKKFFLENKDKVLNRNKKYYNENKEKIKDYNVELRKEKYKSDAAFRLNMKLASKLSNLFSLGKNSPMLSKYLDCSNEDLYNWFEYNFDENMSWSNYASYWQIDHVLPRSYFNHLNDAEICACWNWRNLRPCLIEENNQKCNNIDFDLYYSQILKSIEFIEIQELFSELPFYF